MIFLTSIIEALRKSGHFVIFQWTLGGWNQTFDCTFWIEKVSPAMPQIWGMTTNPPWFFTDSEHFITNLMSKTGSTKLYENEIVSPKPDLLLCFPLSKGLFSKHLSSDLLFFVLLLIHQKNIRKKNYLTKGNDFFCLFFRGIRVGPESGMGKRQMTDNRNLHLHAMNFETQKFWNSISFWYV